MPIDHHYLYIISYWIKDKENCYKMIFSYDYFNRLIVFYINEIGKKDSILI